MILYHFREQGYPTDILQAAFNRASGISRAKLLKGKEPEEYDIKDKQEIVTLLTLFYPNCDPLPKIVRKKWGTKKGPPQPKNWPRPD